MAADTASSAPGYSAWALALAAGSGALAGLALGYRLAQPQRRSGGARRPRSALAARGDGSADSTPAATPRSLSRTDSERGSASGGAGGGGEGLRMVLLVRDDLAFSRAELAEHAARTVLGQFKKQFKRRDPHLRSWEEAGHRMQVLGCPSQRDMLLQQAAARALALPTHTFAFMGGEGRGQRTVMAIGPAPAEQLDQITLHLRELS